MSKRCSFFVYVAMFVLYSATAAAKETTLRFEDHGVLGAMHRMGCRAKWLSVVMRQSGILESDLNSLQAGRRIVAPDECADKSPARADMKVSKRVLDQDVFLRTTKELEGKVSDLQVQVQKEATKSGKAAEAAEVFKKQSKELAEKLRQAQDGEKRAKASAVTGALWKMILGGVIGALLTFGAFWYFTRNTRRENWIFRKEVADLRGAVQFTKSPIVNVPVVPAFTLEYFGELVEFRDTSERFAGCPHCSEKRLKPRPENLRQHLDKHVHLRVVERPVEEIKRLLAG